MKGNPRKLDDETLQLIQQSQSKPIALKTPLKELFFDTAINFGERYLYRIIHFRFDIRKIFFIRHAQAKEEFCFTQISEVQLEKYVKLTVVDMRGFPKHFHIMTQTTNDTIQIFQILRSLSTVPKRCIYQQDYYLDYVNKKMFITCKKRGQKTWAKREMYIYNGLFILYQQGGQIPRTICPLSEKVQITLHPNNIMEITTPIRRILLHLIMKEN